MKGVIVGLCSSAGINENKIVSTELCHARKSIRTKVESKTRTSAKLECHITLTSMERVLTVLEGVLEWILGVIHEIECTCTDADLSEYTHGQK
jgi:hypothetical protein